MHLSLSRYANSIYSFSSLLPIRLYSLSFLVSSLDGIQCLHRADECKFLMVSYHWGVFVLGDKRRTSFMSSYKLLQYWPVCLAHLWGEKYRFTIISKSDLSDKIKWELFQPIAMSLLFYGCTLWILMQHLEKMLNGNYTRMACAALNKSWKLHPTKQQLYGDLLPISQTIEVRWVRHDGNCWEIRTNS